MLSYDLIQAEFNRFDTESESFQNLNQKFAWQDYQKSRISQPKKERCVRH